MVLVFDNAAFHKTDQVTNWLSENNISYLLTGVASYLALPVEMVFAHVKKRFVQIVRERDQSSGVRSLTQ